MSTRLTPRSFRSTLLFTLCAVLLLASAFLACAPAEEPAAEGEARAPEPNRVENEELGLVVVDPVGGLFKVESNEPNEVRLSYAGDETFTPGIIIITAEPEQSYGVNLVDAVNARKVELEEMEGGHFEGQAELMSESLGTAYSTRGGYTGDNGEQVEEIRIFAVHPTADRLVHLTYRYLPTPGQSKAQAPARLLEHAIVAMGYIEPLYVEGEGEMEGGAAPEGEPAGEGEGEPETGAAAAG